MGIGNDEKEPMVDEDKWEEWFLTVQNLNFGKIASRKMVFWMDHPVGNQCRHGDSPLEMVCMMFLLAEDHEDFCARSRFLLDHSHKYKQWLEA